MRYHSLRISLFAGGCSFLASAATAQAAIETWVSGTGSDAGNCAITAPCRTFAYAHSQTSNHGTINVLSSGNFGPVKITKPISIVAQGVEALINSAGHGNAAIWIEAGLNAIVSLRGLTIDMRGADSNGIIHQEGAALHVQDCVIRRTGFDGIFFRAEFGRKELYVANSFLSDGNNGIFILPSAGEVHAVIDRVRVENMANDGISVNTDVSSVQATVRETVTSGNGGAGLFVGGFFEAHVMVDRLVSANNGIGIGAFGIGAFGLPKIWTGNSTVTGNSVGLKAHSSGQIISYGTNAVNGNGTDGAPTSTTAMK